MQFTFSRGLLCTAMLILCNFKNLKRDLCQSVKREDLGSLVFRCSQGGLSVIISFMTVKNFSVSTVGIVCSLAPIFCCIMAYLVLGERMKPIDYMALVAVFAAVCLVILGAKPPDTLETTDTNIEDADGGQSKSNMFMMILLLAQPVLLAAGIIAMRQMRRLPETTCSTY